MNGLFVTFEGPDGSGKSTQLQQLAGYLQAEGIPHLVTREPGGTSISDHIRTLVLDPRHEEMAHETEALLYAASRAQHVSEKIKPALADGKVVLCDRFVDASIAYQGYGLGLDITQVKAINDLATGGLVPDRSYFMDLSPESARQRMLARRTQQQAPLDRIEQKQLVYHKRVREAFQKLADENAGRVCFLDGEEDRKKLFMKIKADFSERWSRLESEGEV